MSETVHIVIPCFNEANRLCKQVFVDFITENRQVSILFVNDGSNDDTQNILENICDHEPGRFHLLNLETNRGKAEAVRRGFVEAFTWKPTFVAMWDADLSTPLTMVIEFREFMKSNRTLFLVMGARVKLLGRNIKRSGTRHILGRLAATLISFTLNLDVYDTQCGAKMFIVNDLTRTIFGYPFQSTWIFDVEVIARIIKGSLEDPNRLIYEFPLLEWNEVGGSKIRPNHYAKSLYNVSAQSGQKLREKVVSCPTGVII